MVSYSAEEQPTGTKRRRLANVHYDRLDADTPYGPIGKVLRFGEEAVQYICPLALLWMMASASEGFGKFFLDCLDGDAGDVILYLDDVRPGNVLRPDPGRVYYSIMWSLAQYPRWYASRKLGWLPLCDVQIESARSHRRGHVASHRRTFASVVGSQCKRRTAMRKA